MAQKGQTVMNGEEELVVFEEWLRSHLVIGGVNMTNQQDSALAAVRELGKAIDPTPLSEVTVKEMKLFEREARCRDKAAYALGMVYFREFRDTVLKPRRMRVQS
jgi:hypothetical protein